MRRNGEKPGEVEMVAHHSIAAPYEEETWAEAVDRF
jgi:hypothetical protein